MAGIVDSIVICVFIALMLFNSVILPVVLGNPVAVFIRNLLGDTTEYTTPDGIANIITQSKENFIHLIFSNSIMSWLIWGFIIFMLFKSLLT